MPNLPFLAALNSRTSLVDQFGQNALLLYALEMRFGIDDIMTVGATAITDGPGDRKCDLIYIDHDTATAVVAQGYYSDLDRPAAPSNKAADLNTAIAWVLGGQRANMAESVAAAAEELDLAIRQGEVEAIELWYCHNLPASQNVQQELERAEETAQGLSIIRYPEHNVSVRALEVGSEKIQEWYASIQSPILVSDDIELHVDGWFEETGGDWTAICASVPAAWLADLLQQYGDRLFSANVRGYMPSRRTAQNINHNMERTARDRPGYFWAFNNGITGLVHDYIAPTTHGPRETLTLKGLAIINGAQTTGALARSRASNLSDAAVLARFVRCDDDSIVDDLIRFNNSQNPIKPSDFRSTDQHQERLRSQFAAIPDVTYYGARRGGEQDRARRPGNLIPSDTTAQCLAAFHGDPGTAYHNLRGIWERDEVYSLYFSDFTTAPHIVFAYSLLTAIHRAKADLIARGTTDGPGLASDELETLSFFRQRGSQFLLMSGIAGCIEILLGQPVPNRFALDFGPLTSPRVARACWQPVVEVLLPFTASLRGDELRGSLRNRTRIDEVLASFRAVVRSTSRNNQSVFAEFKSHLASG
ncbi:MAG TPA: AIPR family protein [Acidimicrobiales bacterium]|nr:AIPR family protein [Acidimicrobiales bacterium]